MTNKVCEEVIIGLKRLAVEIYGNDDSSNRRRAAYQIQRGRIPSRRLGRQVIVIRADARKAMGL